MGCRLAAQAAHQLLKQRLIARIQRCSWPVLLFQPTATAGLPFTAQQIESIGQHRLRMAEGSPIWLISPGPNRDRSWKENQKTH